MVVPTTVDTINRSFLEQLKAFTCNGVAVSELSNCINDGQLCSGDGGVCTNNKCVCNPDREGTYCEDFVSGSDSPLGIILGTLARPIALCHHLCPIRLTISFFVLHSSFFYVRRIVKQAW
jgi:hypothetical protein